jgi:hypothetical protein
MDKKAAINKAKRPRDLVGPSRCSMAGDTDKGRGVYIWQNYYPQDAGRVSHNLKRGEFPNCFDCLSTIGGLVPKMQRGNKHSILERSPAPAALFSTASAGLLYSLRLLVRGWALVAMGRVRAGKVFANHEHKPPVPVGDGNQNPARAIVCKYVIGHAVPRQSPQRGIWPRGRDLVVKGRFKKHYRCPVFGDIPNDFLLLFRCVHPWLQVFIGSGAGSCSQIVIEREIGIDEDPRTGGNMSLNVLQDWIG